MSALSSDHPGIDHAPASRIAAIDDQNRAAEHPAVGDHDLGVIRYDAGNERHEKLRLGAVHAGADETESLVHLRAVTPDEDHLAAGIADRIGPPGSCSRRCGTRRRGDCGSRRRWRGRNRRQRGGRDDRRRALLARYWRRLRGIAPVARGPFLIAGGNAEEGKADQGQADHAEDRLYSAHAERARPDQGHAYSQHSDQNTKCEYVCHCFTFRCGPHLTAAMLSGARLA